MTRKYVAAWFLLILAGFSLVAGIGAFIASVLEPTRSFDNEFGIAIQTVVALAVIYTSISIIRNSVFSVKILSSILLAIAFAAFIESLLFTLRQQDMQFLVITLLLEILPLGILIWCLLSTDQRQVADTHQSRNLE